MVPLVSSNFRLRVSDIAKLLPNKCGLADFALAFVETPFSIYSSQSLHLAPPNLYGGRGRGDLDP